MPAKDPLLLEIEALLAVPEGLDDPALLERTLTDGYARALALEAENRRLAQRIGNLQASAKGPERRQIAPLVRLSERQQGDLGVLREQLGRLRRRHSSVVRAARV